MINDNENKLTFLGWCRRSWCALVCGLLTVIGLSGCGCNSESTGSITPQTPQRTVELVDGTELEVVRDGQVLSIKTVDGMLVPVKNGEAQLGEEMVIRAADGRLEAHRQPTAINRELDKLPYVYLKEGSLEELITDGCLGEPYVHPDDQSFYWTARTCTKPDCDSQSMGSGERPYLFPRRLPGVKLMVGDRVDFVDVPLAELEAPIRCPVCGKTEHVVDYLPSGTADRKQALVDELARVRAARDRVAKSR